MRVFKDILLNRLHRAVVFFNSLMVVFGLGVYAYGGFFSRYLSDDYCESYWLISSQNILEATLKAYNAWLNSYSIMFFIQLGDWAGIWGFRLMSGLTLLFWLSSLMWLFAEIEKILHLSLGPVIHAGITGLTILLSLYQNPAMYQVLYWRTGLIPYTLPLPFFVCIVAYMLRYALQPYRKSRAIWVGVVCFVLVVFASGLGETTSALQIGLLTVAVAVVWLTKSRHRRQDVLIILFTSLVGAVTSILVIGFSPGTTARLNNIMTNPPVYNPVELSLDVIEYTVLFIWDTIKVAPLPNLVAFAVPMGLMLYQQLEGRGWSSNHVLLVLAAVLITTFFVIGCSFAPSAFVRTFPTARARFAANFVLTFGLSLTGAMVGSLLGRMRLPTQPEAVKVALLLILALLSLYPLQVASKAGASIPEYQRFAAAWDERDAYIRASVAGGATDLTVVQLDSVGGVGEYKGNPRFWINVCAARYYGVNSIVAP